MFREPAQTYPAILIEMRYWSLRRVLLATSSSSVIKRDHRAWRFDAAINFRGSGDKSIPRQPHAEAQQRRRKLKNVGIAPDAGILTFGLGRGDEGSHRGTRQRNVRVFGAYNHLPVLGKLSRRCKSPSTLDYRA